MLKSFKLNIKPLLYIAPRGLITILLFMTTPASQSTDLANKSLVMWVVILTSLIMMVGFMTNKKSTDNKL
jgi:hypothetical protein